MIQANDLKIGNRFIREIPSTRGQEFDHDFVLTEEWMGKLFGENTSFALNDLHPIPLTPEILEKAGLPDQEINEKGCGWFHRGNFLVGKTKYHYHFHKNSKRLTLAVVVDLENGSDTTAFAWNIYHLHQLQNLYFALTGEELDVNLKGMGKNLSEEEINNVNSNLDYLLEKVVVT